MNKQIKNEQWRIYTSPEIDWLLPEKKPKLYRNLHLYNNIFYNWSTEPLKNNEEWNNFVQTKEILCIRNTVCTLEACENKIKYDVFANFLIRQETESFGEVKRINSSLFSLAPTEAGHTLKQCFLTFVDINICLL